MLKGKTAIVTGASRGIGRAIVLNLASQGVNIVLNYRNDVEAMQEVIKEIEAKGIKVVAIKGDVSDFKEAENIIKTATESFGSLDILVNNAGITRDGLIMRMKEEDFDSVIDVNLKGTFNCIRHASLVMMKQKSGKIINIASVVGIVGNAGQANYAASKAGIIGITKSVARELAGRGVNVNAVAPGFIETDMTAILSDKVKKVMEEGIPFKRQGKAEEVANVVSFLASDMASYITGQVINVDGGMVM
ncbi:3-oxoacyl-[acyl-carrier-protein] reductase [Clostridium algidicarnis]|uniref:3-oxoacyl-[acyl-carrier-protein] reductase n=1 Tax=Clostridium algidicarnis TaxID=37659 RepID=UPI001C0E4260|nr:3-oxoacyl-[acyl-carrier-protein] reductase [Clostridium algidicarnis]MBU3195245.1 3-oxoacyl-[acyl-carrier-protein] reductase [Clostridium algidicarnis]MBU3208204.1 3-oxoacyl-[acyl-carrier-protein] reductase [Clostridium algidicarnis]MBU3227564.1 3-oxoacyl-[acyl-carrier-protein] reductase [Clostridium algidicarnis]MBU3251029.1 3-oxoacyl-[acyl-carrier-protein] reductase [Clostridium algidicarnis]